MRKSGFLGWLVVYSLPILFTCQSVLAEKGDDNPTGVAGIFNGNITTGCSYDAYTGNGQRQVDDIVVPGGVGSYPLKWTRYWNTHVTADLNWIGAAWRFSYVDWGASYPVTTPDGRFIEQGAYGVEEFVDSLGLRLPDGGIVAGGGGHGTITDPYGQVTTIGTGGTGDNKTTTITEPGGRYLVVHYMSETDLNVPGVNVHDPYHYPDGTVPIKWRPSMASPATPPHSR